jgi:hypothetical protein
VTSDDRERALMAGASAPTRAAVDEAPGIELVARRRLLISPVDAFFRLQPGDHALVKEGEAVGRGQPILEHFREPRTLVVPGASGEGDQLIPGDRAAPLASTSTASSCAGAGAAGASPVASGRSRSSRRSPASSTRSVPALA